MLFGLELRKQFENEAKSLTKVNEEALFEALARAFGNLSSHSATKCEVIHGGKSFVDFSEIGSNSFFYKKDQGKIVRCELADLLFVVVSSSEMRVCCLQNKYEKSRKNRMGVGENFKANMRQFYLLNKRPTFTRDGIKYDLLENAKCPSVASYGVFYGDNDTFDMNYYSAEILQGCTPSAKGNFRKIEMKCGTSQFANRGLPGEKIVELQYADGIVDFGDGLQSMIIGTPLPLKLGLLAIADMHIIDSVEKIIEVNTETFSSIREEIEGKQQNAFYRKAVVIKGNEREQDYIKARMQESSDWHRNY